MAVSDLGDASEVRSIRSACRAEGCTDDRLEDESSGAGCMRCLQSGVEVVGAGQGAIWIGFIERAVIAEAGGDVSPFLEKGDIRGAAGDVAADSHSAESAAVVALAAGEDAAAMRLAQLEEVLTDEFDGGFCRFGAAGSEINPAVTKVGRSEGEEASSEFFRGRVVELGSMGESELRGLSRHGGGDLGDAVADVDDRGGTGSVEKFAAVLGIKPAAFATDSDGKSFVEVARE